MDCISEDGRFTSERSHVYRSPLVSSCAPCPDSECYDYQCNYTARCSFGTFGSLKGTTCGIVFQSASGISKTSCLAPQKCNWNKQLNQSACTPDNSTSGFCGYCFSPHNCIVEPEMKEKSECVGYACLMWNGSYVLTANASTCSSLGRCDQNCPDGHCHANQLVCEAYYECVDIEDLFNKDTPPLEGVCVSRLNPFDFMPDCANGGALLENIGAYPSVQGCVQYNIKKNECKYQWLDNPNLLNSSDSMRMACSKLMTGCYEPKLLLPLLLTNKSSSFCSQCQGSFIHSAHLRQGQWIASKSVAMQWYEREYSSIHQWGPTIDFLSLSQYYEEAILMEIRDTVVSHLECSYNPIRKMLDQSLCYCNNPNSNASSCDDNPTVKIGSAIFCLNSSRSVNFPPMSMRVGEDSLPQSSGCESVRVELLPRGRYSRPVNEVVFSTSFVSNDNKQINTPQYKSVVNKHNINIGQLLGDGVSIKNTGEIENVEFCIQITVEPTAQYPIVDLGIGITSELVVRPLYLPVTIQGKQVCVSAYGLRLRGEQNIFPISYMPNPESVTMPGLSTQDKVLFTLIVICFLLAFLMAIPGFVRKIFYHKQKSVALLREALIAIASLIRAIYFILLMTDVLSPSKENTAQYILVELPTFLYISLTAHLAIAFFLSLKGERSDTNQSLFGHLIVNGITFSCFVVIIILFNVLSSDSTVTISCGGRIFTYSQNNDNIRIIRIVYRVLVTTFSLIASASLIVFGLRLKLFLDNSSVGTGSGSHKTQVRRLFSMATLTGGSLVLNSVAFLIYFIVNTPSSWFVIILFFTEVVSWCYVIVYKGDWHKSMGFYKLKDSTIATTSSAGRRTVPVLDR